MIFSGRMINSMAGKSTTNGATQVDVLWRRALSFLCLLIVWQGSVLLFSPPLLPSPLAVLLRMQTEWTNADMAFHLGQTLARVGIAFSISMVAGSVIGLLMGQSKIIDQWLDGPLTLFLNVPALVSIILCFMWFGLNEFSAILAVVLNKTPNVAVTLREGARAIDQQLMAVARAYQLSQYRRLRQVYLPQLYPYFIGAARNGIALVWKIVLVVELMGCSNGVGFQLVSYFQLFDIAAILAYTVAFVVIILAIEALLLRPLERKLTRWRPC